MIDGRSFYEILEVKSDSSQEDIKKSFRTLSKRYHPDISKLDNADELFREVQQAYDVLSDKELRAEYDKRLKGSNASEFSFDDLWSVFENGKPKTTGENIVLNITLSLEKLAKGGEVTVKFTRKHPCECEKEMCKKCVGTGSITSSVKTIIGEVNSTKICETCKGFGYKIEHGESCDGKKIVKNAEKVIDLTNKVFDKKYIYPGEGDKGSNGGMNGSLIVVLNYEETYEGYEKVRTNDAAKTIPLKLPKFLDPAGVEVEMPNGKILNVLPKINNAAVFPNTSFGEENKKGNTYIDFTIDLSDLDEEKIGKLLKFWRDEIED